MMKAIEYLAIDNAINYGKEDIPRFRAENASSLIRNAKVNNNYANNSGIPRCQLGEAVTGK